MHIIPIRFDANMVLITEDTDIADGNEGNGGALLTGKGTFKAVLAIGAVTGTNPTLDIHIEQSADGSSSWTDIEGAAFAQKDADDADSRSTIVFEVTQDYIREVSAVTGTSTPTFSDCHVFVCP